MVVENDPKLVIICVKYEKVEFWAFLLVLGVYITLTFTLNMGFPDKMSGQPAPGNKRFVKYEIFGSFWVKKWAEKTGKYSGMANMDFFHHRSILGNFLAGVRFDLTKMLL